MLKRRISPAWPTIVSIVSIAAIFSIYIHDEAFQRVSGFFSLSSFFSCRDDICLNFLILILPYTFLVDPFFCLLAQSPRLSVPPLYIPWTTIYSTSKCITPLESQPDSGSLPACCHCTNLRTFFLKYFCWGCFFFLVATKHLYNWLCPLVGWSVCRVKHSFDDPHAAPYWPTWPCLKRVSKSAYSVL